jgi:hypothetical protein
MKLLFLLFSGLLLAQQPVTRILVCTDAGASDTYACTPTVALGSYVTGQRVQLFANTANTGAATLNISALGAKTIKKTAGGITTDLDDNDIRAGQYIALIYNGTDFQLMSPVANNEYQWFVWTIDGGGSVIVASTSGHREVGKACTIDLVELTSTSNLSGTIVVTMDSATKGTTPSWSIISHASSWTLSGAYAMTDTTLTGWTTALTAGKWVRINVTGTPATVVQVTAAARCKTN